MPKHIAVISELNLGSHKAHAINVIKTAGGFVRLGNRVTLLCRGPLDQRPSSELLATYGETNLAVELDPGPAGDDEAASAATGRWAARRAATLGADVVYARHFHGALEARSLGLPTIMETHAHIGAIKPVLDACLRATSGPNPLTVATISPRLRDHYIERGGQAGRIHIIPDGVDLDLFAARPSHSPFEGAGPHILYSGHLYDYKGIPTILEAAALRPRLCFHLLGGTHEDQTRIRAQVALAGLSNVTVHGDVAHAEVPQFLWNADALLLPPSGRDPSAAWTSPVKLGEYLASGPPIVASDIPGLRDWVREPAVRWFRPDDAKDLANAVDAALAETADQVSARGEFAASLAQSFSYPNRARQLLAALRADTHQRRAA
jgi:glycosyltransferase involved in cell wall biosynthesis